MNIPVFKGVVPTVSTEQMVEVDQTMVEDFHIELIQMMENAGRILAHLARVRFLDGSSQNKKVVVLAGTGGNGGGALVSARRLHIWGEYVQVILSRNPDKYKGVPAHQLDILDRIKVSIYHADEIYKIENEETDLIIDGIIGYSLSGPPKGSVARMIRWANNQEPPILAMDVPSGIDTKNGQVFNLSINAEATMSLALPKRGFENTEIKEKLGELYLADISVPSNLYSKKVIGVKIGPLFAQNNILRLELN